MQHQTQSFFTYENYKEESISGEQSGPRLSITTITNRYSGIFQGKGVLGYTTVCITNDSGTFAGVERLTGSLDGQESTFALYHAGTFARERVVDHTTVIQGSGTAALETLHGTADYAYDHGMTQVPITFALTCSS